MAINTWWLLDPAERYWMEITQRSDIGKDLKCPMRPVWSSRLVSHVRPGDRILHWSKQCVDLKPGLIGWSEAIGMPSTLDMSGQDCANGASWFVPLGGLNYFDSPVPSATIREKRPDIFELRKRLETIFGKPVYFPFIQYGEDQIRARQGYLAKFPVKLFEVIPDIKDALCREGARCRGIL